MPWKCFLFTPSDRVQRSFRRYAQGKCSASRFTYHNVEVVIDPSLPAAGLEEGSHLPESLRTDPRWPARCGCGHLFDLGGNDQVRVDRLYAGAPDGQLHTLRDAPVGAMWVADWMDLPHYRGPDGKAWCVKLPGAGEWMVYGPTSSPDRKHWQVKGTPPDITVHPSIHLPGVYHGHIKGGIISEDVEKRKFPEIPRTA